jgi:hypothetical protein
MWLYASCRNDKDDVVGGGTTSPTAAVLIVAGGSAVELRRRSASLDKEACVKPLAVAPEAHGTHASARHSDRAFQPRDVRASFPILSSHRRRRTHRSCVGTLLRHVELLLQQFQSLQQVRLQFTQRPLDHLPGRGDERGGNCPRCNMSPAAAAGRARGCYPDCCPS